MAPGPDNPHDNAFCAEVTVLAAEKAARRPADPDRVPLLEDPQPEPQEWPGPTSGLSADAARGRAAVHVRARAVSRRAGFIRNHLWVTPFAEDERFRAGSYVNQSTGEEGIDVWDRAGS